MSDSVKDYYVILGLTINSTSDDIRKSYKKLAIKWHPVSLNKVG